MSDYVRGKCLSTFNALEVEVNKEYLVDPGVEKAVGKVVNEIVAKVACQRCKRIAGRSLPECTVCGEGL